MVKRIDSPRYLITGKVPKKIAWAIDWLTFSSFRNAIFQNCCSVLLRKTILTIFYLADFNFKILQR